MSNICYIILGSNEGESKSLIEKSLRLVDTHIGMILEKSDMFLTEPWGEKDQNPFINQVIKVETKFGCSQLLIECQRIEKYLGKQKLTKYGPRNIDIDILLYNDEIINEVDLIVPHPKLHERNFVLIPLDQIAGTIIHPILNQSIAQLKENSSDTGIVEILR
jgi:2-amino-4-hydroxy-6-hydroxymethyldihydropteridine diphosphokinase